MAGTEPTTSRCLDKRSGQNQSAALPAFSRTVHRDVIVRGNRRWGDFKSRTIFDDVKNFLSGEEDGEGGDRDYVGLVKLSGFTPPIKIFTTKFLMGSSFRKDFELNEFFKTRIGQK